MLSRNGESLHPCLVSDFVEIFEFFSIWDSGDYGLPVYCLYSIEMCPLYSYFLQDFYCNWTFSFGVVNLVRVTIAEMKHHNHNNVEGKG